MTQAQDEKACPKCGAALPARASLCQQCGFNLARSSNGKQDHVGRMLGNLRLTRIIGEGGMGSIYQAEHQSLGTKYAVKVLHKSMSRDQVFAERFRREAMACSRLRHPNIVFVTDFGKHPEMGLYLVMEHLQGEDLCSYQMRVGRLELWRALRIAAQVCDALQMAHKSGIVHRDLKPENIFLTLDHSKSLSVKLLDFGVARIKTGGNTQLTMQGIAVGTPYYMSPEQTTGKSDHITAASDIYALGAIIHEIVVGGPLFNAESPFQIMSKHLREAPPLISRWRPELKDSALEKVLQQMLAKPPEDRPASAARTKELLLEALQELQSRNIEDAFEPQDAALVKEGGEELRTARLSGIVRHLPPPPRGPRLGSALKHLSNLPSLDDELLFWMAWGVLSRDLLDTDVAGEGYPACLKAGALFMEHVLDSADPEQPELTQQRLARALRDLLALAEKPRRKPLVEMLQPLMSHPLFPTGDLPSWALPNINGSWSGFRSLLSTPVMDLFRKSEGQEEPQEEAQALEAHDDLSLGDKLRQDISLDSMRSILNHEFRLFKRKEES